MKNDSADIPRLRKQLLLARSTLARLQAERHLHDIRGRLGWIQTGRATMAVIDKAPVRATLLQLAWRRTAGSGHLSRAITLAARTLLLARLACLLIPLNKNTANPPPFVRQRTDRLPDAR